ncbi:MAG: pseudouridine-5'-phosphate glycosidase [Candidatus Eremiobacterota bacterium]
MIDLPEWAECSPDVREALAAGKPVVALESSVWAHGLPRPINLEVAQETQEAVRSAGAVPAIIALKQGRVHYGLSFPALEDFCGRNTVSKVGIGDIPAVLATRSTGATTVSATLALAEQAGIRIMATGGLGGVHLNWTSRLDISSDLGQLARTRCLTVCSGVKSVLDVPATVEMLETLGIPVALYRTDRFPRFYTSGLAIGIGFRVDSPVEAARAHQLAVSTLNRGLLVTQPVPAEHELPSEDLEGWLREGMLRAEADGQTAKQVTPFLLDYLARASNGQTLEANRALLLSNARLAAEIACATAKGPPPPPPPATGAGRGPRRRDGGLPGGLAPSP